MSTNRLSRETSPYLLQHAGNPVHWWAWGPEALAEAQRTGKPILLSVGYAACHWCHVMAHESFEDEATAAVMNELFVNIKVDREERPDIDAIYMGALHALGEQGGWPLTMFLDSQARPVWGGTYFPKGYRHGRPAFVDVLQRVAAVFREEPGKVAENAEALTEALANPPAASTAPTIDDKLLRDLTTRMSPAVDPRYGGLQGAPKFPQWSFFWLLWRGGIRYDDKAARDAVIRTLDNICQGGIYDHLGGGFARYSVDERWLVPHFEKMLYDNALLIDLMTEVYRETGSPLYRARIAETAGWLEREMIADGGGFAASLDADSEGEEGKFYVWSLDDVIRILGAEDGKHFAEIYDVTRDGNFEGHNILNRLDHMQFGSDEEEHRLAAMRSKLLAERGKRVRPGWDDKVLADWNGLMIAALTRASIVFDEPKWLELARRAFAFVAEHMTEGDRLKHSYRAGKTRAPATASDYANMIWAALRLFEATGDRHYFEQAIAWTTVLDKHYWVDGGGYATSADDTDDVIVRLRPGTDDATPNANAIMMSNLVALSALSGDGAFLDRAQELLDVYAGEIGRNIVAHTGLLSSTFDLISPQQVVVAGEHLEGGARLIQVIRTISLPGALQYGLTDLANGSDLPGLRDKQAVNRRATAYVCVGPHCSPALTDPAELGKALMAQRSLHL